MQDSAVGEKTLAVCALECSPLDSLFGDDTFADVEIVAHAYEDDDDEAEEGEEGENPSRSFSAHRAVLAACSPYFRSMFSSGFAESNKGASSAAAAAAAAASPVVIRGVSPTSLELLLRFCYSGRLAAVPRSQLLPLASLADRLDVPALRSAVDAAIDADLGPATAAAYLAAAAAMRDIGGGGGGCGGCGGGFGGSSGFLGEEEGIGNSSTREALLDRCLDALCAEFSAASAQPAFLSLSEATLAAVLEREDLVASSEAEVFDAVCRWAQAAAAAAADGEASPFSRLAARDGPPSSSAPPPPLPPPSAAFERLCRRVRFGSMDPSDLASAAAHPLARASRLVQGMVLRAFVHIHAPRKPDVDAGGEGGTASSLRGGGNNSNNGARAATAAAMMMMDEEDFFSSSSAGPQQHLLGHGLAPAAPPPLSPETPPLLAEEEEQGQQQQQQRHQKSTFFSSSSSSSSSSLHHHHHHHNHNNHHHHHLDAFRGDSVSLPPRGGAGARLRLRVVVADGACSWPADPAAPPCPPGRHCGCPPPTAGAAPRGLSLTVPRDWPVALLKKRACRDLGLDPRAFALFDFYNGQKYGRGPLCHEGMNVAGNGGGGGGDNGSGGGGDVGGGEAAAGEAGAAAAAATTTPTLTCGGADLRDGQLVLLELIRR